MPSEPVAAPTEPLLTVNEAADRLGVSPQTIKRRIHDGSLPALKTGRYFRIRQRDLARLLSRYEAK